MTRGKLRGLLACLAVGLFVSASALATGAGAASPEQVTITAVEFFPAPDYLGEPFLITIE